MKEYNEIDEEEVYSDLLNWVEDGVEVDWEAVDQTSSEDDESN